MPGIEKQGRVMLTVTISRRGAFIIALAVVLAVPAIAIAGSVFDDVDDTHTHAAGIEYLKDSGVSLGCDANNNYCPDDFVTRAQMATFMYRLSGNDPDTPASVEAATLGGLTADDFAKAGDPGSPGDADTLDGLDSTDFLLAADTAVDAELLDGLDSTDFLGAAAQAVDSDQLDGMDSADFLGVSAQAADSASVDGFSAADLTRVAFSQTTDSGLVGPTNGTAVSADITAPVDGHLVISASANAQSDATGGTMFQCFLELDTVTIDGSLRGMEHDGDETPAVNREENCATDAVEGVAAGTYTVSLEFSGLIAGTAVDDASIWVLFVPFDGTGMQYVP